MVMDMEHASTPATRVIETMRRIAYRLRKGLPLKEDMDQPAWFEHAAAEFERINKEMQRRHYMGHAGAYTGLVDRNGDSIYIGDTLRFDPQEWGGECVFQLTFQQGQLQHPGTIEDLTEFCELVEPRGAPMEPTVEAGGLT